MKKKVVDKLISLATGKGKGKGERGGGFSDDLAPPPPSFVPTHKIIARASKITDQPFELCMSDEMTSWLHDSVNATDDTGYMPDHLANLLAAPMDSFSTFCPTGAIVASKYAASKAPSIQENEDRGRTYNDKLIRLQNGPMNINSDKSDEVFAPESANSMAIVESKSEPVLFGPTSIYGTGKIFTSTSHQRGNEAPLIGDAVDRLEVMWLQRRAQFEREEGDKEKALETLQEALNLHLGVASSYQDNNKASYLKARLGDKLPASDPVELLNVIEQNYFIYDDKTHQKASRIQRFYHRHYTAKCKAASLVTKFYKRYFMRKEFWKMLDRKRQAAILIQRLFRWHYTKCKRLATRIKLWYRTRRQMKEFMKKLRVFRWARAIQKLFRGNEGRKIYKEKYGQYYGRLRLQRTARGYMSRRERSFALALYHKMFFLAARKIQSWIRRLQAIRKAQLQLLKEVAREEDRYNREKMILEELIRLELARSRLYLKTIEGQMHVADVRKRIDLKDDRFYALAAKNKVKQEDILAKEAMASFELFDSDGSGAIDNEELALLLHELGMPMGKKAVQKLAREMDKDGSGDIDFNEFLDWYCYGGASNALYTGNLTDIVTKNVLAFRHFMMNISGTVLARRSEREVLRQCTSWLSKNLANAFRANCPPKFQCCRCLKPFVLFTDYYSHFDDEGICVASGQKAQYYKSFWTKQEWSYQRQLEHEILRYSDEGPMLNYYIMKEAYAEMALQKDLEIQWMMRKYRTQCEQVWRDKLGYNKLLEIEHQKKQAAEEKKRRELEKKNRKKEEAKNKTDKKEKKGKGTKDGGDKKDDKDDDDKKGGKKKKSKKSKEDKNGGVPKKQPLGQFVVDILNLFGNDDVSVFGLKVVCDYLGQELPKDWIIDDKYVPAEIYEWIIKLVDKKKLLTRFELPTFGLKSRIRRDSRILSTLFMRILRVLRAEAEASLVALMEFRMKRIRKITMPFEELERLGLEHLGDDAFQQVNTNIIDKLRKLDDSFKSILKSSMPRCCFGYLPSCISLRTPQVGVKGELTRQYMDYIFSTDAHTVANAKYRMKTRSLIGKTEVKRLRAELWAMRKLLWDFYRKSNVPIQISELRYTYERFTARGEEKALSTWDFDKFIGESNARIRDAVLDGVLREIDPGNTGFISFRDLHVWLKDKEKGKNWKRFGSVYRVMKNVIINSLCFILNLQYSYHAHQMICNNLRMIQRIELQFKAQSIKMYVPPEEEEEQEKNTNSVNATNETVPLAGDQAAGDYVGAASTAILDPMATTADGNGEGTDPNATTSGTETEPSNPNPAAVAGTDTSANDNANITKGGDGEGEGGGNGSEDGEEDNDGDGNNDGASSKNENGNGETMSKNSDDDDGIERVVEEEIDPVDDNVLMEQIKVKLRASRGRNEQAEMMLLYKLTEIDAAKACMEELFSRVGFSKILHERNFILASDDMIRSYGCLVPYSAKYPWSIYTEAKYKEFRTDFLAAKETVQKDGILELVKQRWIKKEEEDVDVTDMDIDPDYDFLDGVMEEPSELVFDEPYDIGWALALAVMVQTYDTDCSGTFDEGEVSLMLRCSKCGLSEREILYHFPEVRRDSAMIDKLVRYLSNKVTFQRGWLGRFGYKGGLSIWKRNGFLVSSLVLLSLSQQMARQRAEEVTILAKTGKLIEEDDGMNNYSLITRCQLFAVRQVNIFLKTIFAKMKLKEIKYRLRNAWNVHMVAKNYSVEGMLNYAYHVHNEKGLGIVITDIPYLVRFVMDEFGLQPDAKGLDAVGKQLFVVRGQNHIKWVIEFEALELLMNIFKPDHNPELNPDPGLARRLLLRCRPLVSLHSDAKWSMRSQARQQAVLIAMKIDGVFVAETNYRCSILGLYDVMREKTRLESWGILRSRTKYKINWDRAPKEAMTLRVMSGGYSYEQLSMKRVAKYVSTDHKEGVIVASQVDVDSAMEEVWADAKEAFYFADYVIRYLKLLSGFGLVHYYMYRKVAKHIKLYTPEINALGAAWLRELITGVSNVSNGPIE